MSTRVTEIGVEFATEVTNVGRVTEIGVEFATLTINTLRLTDLGAEYIFRELMPAHGLSNYLKDALVNHLFRGTTFVKPAHLWVALYTLPPNATGGGTEVVGGGYARAQLDPGEVNWGAPSAGDGTSSNGVDIVFPTPTGSWGLVTAAGIFDAPSGGNLLSYTTLTTPATIGVGNNPRFTPGKLSVSLA